LFSNIKVSLDGWRLKRIREALPQNILAGAISRENVLTVKNYTTLSEARREETKMGKKRHSRKERLFDRGFLSVKFKSENAPSPSRQHVSNIIGLTAFLPSASNGCPCP
jgi:hypothetical protein